jgi:4-alpha-glucanotransferase
MQDFLGLGSWARMNYPGNASGNWAWRMRPNALDGGLAQRIYEINYLYGRLPESEKQRIRDAMLKETEGKVMPH